MGPLSSPAERTHAPGPSESVRRLRSAHPKNPLKALPTITVYVPLVGAFTATFDAPVPVALFLRSTPVGDTSRDRKSVVEGKSVDLGGRRIIKKKRVAVNVHVSRSAW